MNNSKRKFVWQGLLMLIIVIIGYFVFINFLHNKQVSEPKQLIFIGIDGMQVGHFQNMLDSDRLPHFSELVSHGGLVSNALITGHRSTITAPGNAELHTGLNSDITGIVDNSCSKAIPKGLTIFERLHGFDPNIQIGSIYGKDTCYIPKGMFSNASDSIAWQQNKTTYVQRDYVTKNCTDSRDVATKAIEFIDAHVSEPLYLFMYFGSPDCVGHMFGENSSQYDDAIINVDSGIGILLDALKAKEMSPEIVVSGDHGWNEATKDHSIRALDTSTVVLLSNDATLINKKPSESELRKQCDIAPTILNYFGMKASKYSDIVNNGCESLSTK